MNDNFIFTDDEGARSYHALNVIVPRSINSKADLLGLLSRDLYFPKTFGANWDALFDCLCDLSWIRERRIVIAHESVPSLPAADLRAYLGVLGDAVTSWRDNPGVHELAIIFPKAASATLL